MPRWQKSSYNGQAVRTMAKKIVQYCTNCSRALYEHCTNFFPIVRTIVRTLVRNIARTIVRTIAKIAQMPGLFFHKPEDEVHRKLMSERFIELYSCWKRTIVGMDVDLLTGSKWCPTKTKHVFCFQPGKPARVCTCCRAFSSMHTSSHAMFTPIGFCMSSDFCCGFDMALFVARYLFRNFGWNAIDIEKLEKMCFIGRYPYCHLDLLGAQIFSTLFRCRTRLWLITHAH